ncbi:MAG: SAM-dependent methyltransferase [Muribaculaceae bacterium]|nr:SAM-dependent methyltransferase [Muribaculaceae bacterium]
MDSTPKLYLFPVPLSDVAPEQVLPGSNLELLLGIRYFVVENLRSARRFLKACHKSIDINSLEFTELNEHTPAGEVEAMLAPMADGHSIGVVSEAGCPAVADPGADLVAAAQRRGYEVVPLVGPSSILMSLMGSGFNGQCFTFNGYLPVDAQARARRLKDMQQAIRRDRCTQIFIETPYRNNKLIDELCRVLPGDMLLCVASDITGPRQRITTRRIDQWRRIKPDYDKIPAIFLLFI